MDTEDYRKVIEHPTICRGSSFPPLEKCTDCCSPGLYHCPFCPPECFEPTKRRKLMLHLESHRKFACSIKGYTVHKCSFGCRRKPHYHCLHCEATLIRRRDFVNHVPLCVDALKTKHQNQSKLQRFMVTDDTDSNDICDSEDSHEDSSGHFLNPVASGMSTHGSPNSSNFSQRLQTHVEKPQDCDEFYFMNLVKIFKRLTPQKKTDVRLRIERILFEAEFQ